MLKNYTEIMEMRSEGFCESCGYGFDKCLEEGKAFCLGPGKFPDEPLKEEDKNEKEPV